MLASRRLGSEAAYAEVFPAGSNEAVRPGQYTFADAAQATAFVTEAVESLMYLGCDVEAG